MELEHPVKITRARSSLGPLSYGLALPLPERCSADLDMEGWLCPALFRYFEEAPKALYAQVKPLP
jgi:hypothetical protein